MACGRSRPASHVGHFDHVGGSGGTTAHQRALPTELPPVGDAVRGLIGR
ncbi:hypothetical protein ACFY7F_31625 [Streptomyces griseofuscus]